MPEEPIENDSISKSELKRQMSALQSLGESLLEVDDSVLLEISIGEQLFEAINIAKKIKKREGRRRQLQFVGKLMRKEPEETIQRIRKLLESKNKLTEEKKVLEHQTENWREKLLQGNDEEIQRFIVEHPNADRQWLRQTVRTAKKEISTNATSTQSRKLFRYIRDQLSPQ